MNTFNEIKNFDYNSKNSKLALSFLIPAVCFFIFAPGVIFEINPKDNNKLKCENKVPYSTALVHSVLFGLLMFAVYYFYLSKMSTGVYRATI